MFFFLDKKITKFKTFIFSTILNSTKLTKDLRTNKQKENLILVLHSELCIHIILNIRLIQLEKNNNFNLKKQFDTCIINQNEMYFNAILVFHIDNIYIIK